MAGKTRAQRFLNAFMTVWTVHKSGEPSEMVLSAYNKALDEFDIEDVERAFAYALKDLQWFPKPVELRTFIESGPGDVDDIALVEADKVINAIREVGMYKSVAFDNPITMAVIDRGWGGWIKICDLQEDEVKWFRKDFVKIYKAYSNQGIKRYGHLIGYHEDHNLARFGEHLPMPILIGDAERASKVLEYKPNNIKHLAQRIG